MVWDRQVLCAATQLLELGRQAQNQLFRRYQTPNEGIIRFLYVVAFAYFVKSRLVGATCDQRQA